MYDIIYYETSKGECLVKNFIETLNENNQQKMFYVLQLLKEVGIELHRPYSDYLRDGIHELRVKLSGKETRTLYFFYDRSNIILTHTFIKNTDAVSEKEIAFALKCKEDYINNINKKI